MDPLKIEALKTFARARIRETWQGCEGGGEVQEHATELGLIEWVPGGYDPEKHSPSEFGCEPGDPWAVLADWLREPRP